MAKRFLKIGFLLVSALICSFFTGLPANPHGYAKTGTSPLSRPKRIVIAMVPKSLDNPVFVDAKETAELAARKLDVILEWVAPFKVDAAAQAMIIEGLIRRKVDGIAVSCSDPQKIKPVINKAVAAGIKVATFDADCPGSKRLFYCGTDNYQAGYACGEAMANIIRKRGLSHRELNAAILTGGLNAHNLNERIRGFKKAVSDRGVKLKYEALLGCDDDTITGVREVEAYINKNPQTKVFFFAGGWAFFAPAESMPLYQEWCRQGGIAVSMDTFYPVLQAAKKGFVQALIGQDFRMMGEFTVSYLVCAIKGLPIPSEYIITGLERADQSNFDQLLKMKKPWEMK
ncbi:MAG: substrate-binding domain-containing protein [Firmicutes bacterium]|nr:substrate-binding domain-containing protein [Bacillota bacterium]